MGDAYQNFRGLLDALGIERGDVLYVHTSFKRMAHAGLSAEQMLAALTEQIGPAGTLVLPAFSWNTDRTGRPWLGYTNHFRGEAVFDARTSPANIGHVPEAFRLSPGVRRSVHYWYSVCARGPLAVELTDGQEHLPHPWGPGSAFDQLYRAGVKILGLGVSLNTTSLSLLADYALGERHTQQVFTDEPRVGVVFDHEGNRVESKSFWLLPEAVKRMKPNGVMEGSERMREAVRRVDVGETIHFTYPYQVYQEEAMRLGEAACAEGRGVPWLDNFPLKQEEQSRTV